MRLTRVCWARVDADEAYGHRLAWRKGRTVVVVIIVIMLVPIRTVLHLTRRQKGRGPVRGGVASVNGQNGVVPDFDSQVWGVGRRDQWDGEGRLVGCGEVKRRSDGIDDGLDQSEGGVFSR